MASAVYLQAKQHIGLNVAPACMLVLVRKHGNSKLETSTQELCTHVYANTQREGAAERVQLHCRS